VVRHQDDRWLRLPVSEEGSRQGLAASFVVDPTRFGAADMAAPIGWLLEQDWRTARRNRGRGGGRRAAPAKVVEAGRVGAADRSLARRAPVAGALRDAATRPS
jgi:hypothetical protein